MTQLSQILVVIDTAESVKIKFSIWSSTMAQQCHWNQWVKTQWCHWHRWVNKDTTESILETFIGSQFIKRENQTKFKQGWTIFIKACESKVKKMGFPKETFLTQQCHFEVYHLREFEVICENTSECETVAPGKMFQEKTKVKILWDCLFKATICYLISNQVVG